MKTRKQYLDMRDILAKNPELQYMEDNAQVKLRHADCRDTKERLIIRKTGETWLGYCHHCTLGGATGGKKSYIKRQHNITVNGHEGTLALPADLQLDVAQCDPRFNAWLGKYGITQAERWAHRVGWSEKHSRGILPVYNGEGRLVAYQMRHLLPNDFAPKYLTTRLSTENPLFRAGPVREGDVLVLTEDMLSAIVVNRSFPAFSLLGVYLAKAAKYDIINLHPGVVVVWLDDDNPRVKQQQRKILHELQPFVPTVVITGHTVDPKEMTSNTIEALVEAALHSA